MRTPDRSLQPERRSLVLSWTLAGAALVCCAFVLSATSSQFAYTVDVVDRPIGLLVAGYMLAGIIFLIVARYLVPRSLGAANRYPLLVLIVVFGLGMRLALFGSVPVQEDDFHRYLWDGAMTANGINPWSYSPRDILDGVIASPTVDMLQRQAGDILERINYGELRSIYPALAQAAFALAYFIEPFSLEAWRSVLLGLELITLALIFRLLAVLNRPLVWSSLYWWNPVVIKEVMNSGHMEPVLMVPLLGALLLAVNSRFVAASGTASLAVAAKVWPVLVLPTLWRPLLSHPARLGLAVMLAAILIVLLYWPIAEAQLDHSSGFVAFSTEWERISASFIALTYAASWVPQSLVEPEALARVLTATAIGLIVVWSNRTVAADANELAHRFLLATAAMLLLSPVQLPWYFIWLAPFLCLFPYRGLLLMTVTFPLYYAFFKLTALGTDEVWLLALVWIMWLPVWGLLLVDWRSQRYSHAPTGRMPETA